MFDVIDLLAASYGWAKEYILENVYPDEVPEYNKRIVRRKRHEKMLELRIAHNPHLKEKDAWTLFNELQSDPGDVDKPATLDKTAFDMVRGRISSNPNSKFRVK